MRVTGDCARLAKARAFQRSSTVSDLPSVSYWGKGSWVAALHSELGYARGVSRRTVNLTSIMFLILE